jgi:hypothetical protein
MTRPVQGVPILSLVSSALWLAASLAGCGEAGDGLPREAVSGTVTLDGKPLARGVLQMLPAGQGGGTPCGALIEDGKFAIARRQGPVPGEYVVTINSSPDGAPGGAPAGPPGPVSSAERPKELIPPEYNAQSKLTATVKADSPNMLEFALKSK